jgi:hypothetical protein
MTITTAGAARIGALLAAAAMSGYLPTALAADAPAAVLPAGCTLADPEAAASVSVASGEPPFPPVQLELRTPVEPSVLPSGGRNFLYYEVHLQNFSDQALALRGIEVRDAAGAPIAKVNAEALEQILRPVGLEQLDGQQLGPGQAAVVFMCVAFAGDRAVPASIEHRVLLDQGYAAGPALRVRHAPLPSLGLPVSGEGWLAANAPSINSHHRVGLFVAGGLAQISRRFAIDWKIVKDGAEFSGDPLDASRYYAYGKEVLAVADGTIVLAQDGLPDNIPRTTAGFETAVPMTMENLAGNSLILDIGGGRYAYYAHLKPGSLRVKAGDQVQRGEVLGQVGISGDARWPHLHFQVSDAPEILASEGLPFVFAHFQVRTADGSWADREAEYPLADVTIAARRSEPAE